MKIILWQVLAVFSVLLWTINVVYSFLNILSWCLGKSEFSWIVLIFIPIGVLSSTYSIWYARNQIRIENQKNTSAAEAYRKRLDEAFKGQVGNGNKIL